LIWSDITSNETISTLNLNHAAITIKYFHINTGFSSMYAILSNNVLGSRHWQQHDNSTV
jgi:hypothetical protein